MPCTVRWPVYGKITHPVAVEIHDLRQIRAQAEQLCEKLITQAAELIPCPVRRPEDGDVGAASRRSQEMNEEVKKPARALTGKVVSNKMEKTIAVEAMMLNLWRG